MLIELHKETDRGDIITLKADLCVHWRGRIILVPKGFQSDGCSTPRFLWASVSPAIHPETLRAAIAHDYIYRVQPKNWDRIEADEMFYDVCREDGLSWWKAQKAYWGLRLFGGKAWDDNRDQLDKLLDMF